MEKKLRADPLMDGESLEACFRINASVRENNVSQAIAIARTVASSQFGIQGLAALSLSTLLRCDLLLEYLLQHGYRIDQRRRITDGLLTRAMRDGGLFYELLDKSGFLKTSLRGTMTGFRIFLNADNPDEWDHRFSHRQVQHTGAGKVLCPSVGEFLKATRGTQWSAEVLDCQLVIRHPRMAITYSVLLDEVLDCQDVSVV